MKLTAVFIVSLLAACQSDETVRAYGGADRVWALELLNDKPFTATATLTFPEEGRIAGQAPCNRYFGGMTVPYPWFKADAIGSTKMACPDLDAEQIYFHALGEATLSEVAGDTLILSNTDGLEMVFKARD